MKYLLVFYLSIFSLSAFSMDSLKVSKMPKYRYYVYAGMFFPTTETTLRVDGKYLGTYVNLENDFNMKGKGVSFRTEALAQLSPRSSVSLTYFSIFNNGHTTLDRDITFGDSTFHAGADLSSYFNIRFMGASYRYSIFYKENWSLGLTTGVRVLNMDVGATIHRQNGDFYSKQFSTYIPVVLFGIHGSAYITPRFLARYSLEYFGLKINGISGGVLDNRLTLEYYILKNFSLGGSFTHINYKVNNFPLTSRFDGEVNYSIMGFSLYVGARF
ncbi:MAG TPA: hypothetical protein VK796_08770 [Cytophaga sp.]|jgi:hypothetical protein|nr:hypothetical protein [Cytophaga sp.]